MVKEGIMKQHWTDKLSSEVYSRLCACRTIKADLPELVNAKWVAYQEKGLADRGFTKEDALIAVLEHLDSNSCYFDLTKEEYNALYK